MKERDLPRAIDLQQQIAACDERLKYLDSVRFDLVVPNALPPESPTGSMQAATLSSVIGMDEGVVFGEARQAIRRLIEKDRERLRSELERLGIELDATLPKAA